MPVSPSIDVSDALVGSNPLMSPSPHAVLVETVTLAEEAGEPVSSARLAESLDVPEPALADPLDSLCEYELLAATGDGYRPTVTAHELLALDVELDDTLVVYLVDE